MLKWCHKPNQRIARLLQELSLNEAKAKYGEEPFELKTSLKLVRTRIRMPLHTTDTVYVTIDKEAVRKSGMMMASDSIPIVW